MIGCDDFSNLKTELGLCANTAVIRDSTLLAPLRSLCYIKMPLAFLQLFTVVRGMTLWMSQVGDETNQGKCMAACHACTVCTPGTLVVC